MAALFRGGELAETERDYMKQTLRWLSSMELATRYRVSVHSLEAWRRWQGFPQEAVRREGIQLLFDQALVDHWLRSRRVSTRGWKPRWLEVVQHPALKEMTN